MKKIFSKILFCFIVLAAIVFVLFLFSKTTFGKQLYFPLWVVDHVGLGATIADTSFYKVAEKYDAAAPIKAKYQLNRASLKRVAKDDPRDRIEVQIGNKDDAEFLPGLKIARWDDEVNLTIKPKALEGVAKKDKDLKLEGDKIKFETPDIDYHLYELTEGEGGYEFEVILKEKPATNKIEFTLETWEMNRCQLYFSLTICVMINPYAKTLKNYSSKSTFSCS